MSTRFTQLHPIYQKASFYAALSGYINAANPAPKYMVGSAQDMLSGEDWLGKAKALALQIAEGRAQLESELERVQAWLHEGNLKQAQQFLRKRTQETDAEIRTLEKARR